MILYGVRRLVASPADRDTWTESSDELPLQDDPATGSGSDADEA